MPVDLHVVGRIRPDDVRQPTLEQPIVHGSIARRAADQGILPENPLISQSGDRRPVPQAGVREIIRQVGRVILVTQQDRLDFGHFEARDLVVIFERNQIAQFKDKPLLVPFTRLLDLVERERQAPDLRIGQIIDHNAGDHLRAEQPRGGEAGMAVDDLVPASAVLASDKDRDAVAEALHRAFQLHDLCLHSPANPPRRVFDLVGVDIEDDEVRERIVPVQGRGQSGYRN